MLVVGSPFSKAEHAVINPKFADRIVVVSGVTNTDLNLIYNYAHALIYPSSYEGFGIPVAEAMKAGCPVLGLNRTAIPEVAGGAGLLFDTLTINTFVAAIRQLSGIEFRNETINAGLENAQRFDWAKCQADTKDFYNEVYNNFQ